MARKQEILRTITNFYLFERRATPATLTGDKGRPTSAEACDTKPASPVIDKRSPRDNNPTTIMVPSTIAVNFPGRLIHSFL